MSKIMALHKEAIENGLKLDVLIALAENVIIRLEQNQNPPLQISPP